MRATTLGVVGVEDGLDLDIANLLVWLNVTEASVTDRVLGKWNPQLIPKFALSFAHDRLAENMF